MEKDPFYKKEKCEISKNTVLLTKEVKNSSKIIHLCIVRGGDLSTLFFDLQTFYISPDVFQCSLKATVENPRGSVEKLSP